jgi:citrate synthase
VPVFRKGPDVSPSGSAPGRAELVDARQAMAVLGVKPQTLYAYVSRGLIRAVNPQRRKLSLYYREDIEALQLRGRAHNSPGKAAQRALRVGGEAVMDSSITELTVEGPRYRGQLATSLVEQGQPFETCVALLWQLRPDAAGAPWRLATSGPGHAAFVAALRACAPQTSSRRLLALAIESWAACAGADSVQDGPNELGAAQSILQAATAALGLLAPRPRYSPLRPDELLACGLARALGTPTHADAIRALDAALILCADHELAPSTFAARIAASAGADLHSCVTSALGAFEGLFTGYGCDLAETLLRQAGSASSYVEDLVDRARRKEPLPGYDHPLYPKGDPRGRALLGMAEALAGRRPAARRACQAIKGVQETLGAQPSLTIALAALGIALDQPPRTAAAVMALGRCAGWVAHVQEQRQAGFLVRPRARYVAPVPATAGTAR